MFGLFKKDSSKNWPTKNQWRQFFKVLSKKEKKLFFFSLLLAILSFSVFSFSYYLKNTEVVAAEGGIHIEGVLGSPRFINPIYAERLDADRDLSELIYSGLMKYDKNGKIVPDLVEKYEILEDGRVYEFFLKENLSWSDGEPLTVEDVLFTIKTIQNPSLKSLIRPNWLGVSAEKISDRGIRLELNNHSSVFLKNCAVKILPKHIWEGQDFALSVYNLKTVGSGPYKYKRYTLDNEHKMKSYELIINPEYHGERPNISEIKFFFFETEEEIIKAFNSKTINSFSLSSLDKYEEVKRQRASEHLLSMPRYFAVFFNPEKAEIFKEKSIREALNYSIDKENMINEVLSGLASPVHSPVIPEVYGFEQSEKIFEYNPEEAKKMIEEQGFAENESGVMEKTISKTPSFQFTSNLAVGSQGAEVKELQKCLAKYPDVYPDGDTSGYFGPKTKAAVIKFQEKYRSEILAPYNLSSGNGLVRQSTRKKLNELCAAPSEKTFTLSFVLATVDQPAMLKVAEYLKNAWKEMGIGIEIKTYNVSDLEEDIIKPREYEMLLFGEVLGAIPDPYPFWHSSQVSDPGLNLAGYENAQCDKLLEAARTTSDSEERKQALEEFQNVLIADAPAVLLYNPDYVYMVSDNVKGISANVITDPSKRFGNIEDWYIKTKRVWK